VLERGIPGNQRNILAEDGMIRHIQQQNYVQSPLTVPTNGFRCASDCHPDENLTLMSSLAICAPGFYEENQYRQQLRSSKNIRL
jgi:hypothetical protein